MNRPPSDTVSADVFLVFEDDARDFVIEEGQISTPIQPPAAAVIDQLKTQLAALTAEQRAELASFLVRSLEGDGTDVAAVQVLAELRQKHS